MTSTELHYLNRKWDLWYHDPNNTCYTLESYIKLGTIDTIESFWNYFYQLKLTQLQNGMFFLMHEGVKPPWEDNIKGGSWSYKIDKKDIAQAWTKLSVHLLSDNFIEENEAHPNLPTQMVGISISPKKTFSIFKVWIDNHVMQPYIKIIEALPFLQDETPMYRSHEEVKAKEEMIRQQQTN